MYEDLRTSVKSLYRVTENLNVGVGVHPESVLSPYLFSMVINEVTKKYRVRYHGIWYLLML
jgi:hypothetical protein